MCRTGAKDVTVNAFKCVNFKSFGILKTNSDTCKKDLSFWANTTKKLAACSLEAFFTHSKRKEVRSGAQMFNLS